MVHFSSGNMNVSSGSGPRLFAPFCEKSGHDCASKRNVKVSLARGVVALRRNGVRMGSRLKRNAACAMRLPRV